MPKKAPMTRKTKQREVILKCLSEQKRPLSIEEILSYCVIEIPAINLSTIYRNLKILLQSHEIALVDLPKEKPRYEIARGHRHHFLCDKCHKLFPVSGCPKELLSMVPAGFTLLGHSITLNGYCRECR